MRRFLLITSALALGLVGCTDGDGDGDTDAGPAIMLDAGEPGGECVIPDDGFGASAGRNLLPFTLQECNGTPWEFYGETEGYCDSSFTVIVMSAGWCGPCRAEAEFMEAELVSRYADQNVRVVVALIQDNSYSTPDQAFCDGWVSQYGLSNPVLLDGTQETQLYFPMGALPANLIVDNQGRIRHREYGFSEALGTIRAELDALLAEE